VEKHFIFDDRKIGSLMDTPLSVADAKRWFGAPPPDLTLVARARGDAWVYTYLKSFYLDAARPYGYNNLVFKDVGMPNVLANLQGSQSCQAAESADPSADAYDACARVVHLHGTGTLSPEEFDGVVTDLVSFLVYAAEPVRLYDKGSILNRYLGLELSQRETVGVWSLIYLAVFLFFAFLLNREYWKNIH
jgi:cytochrome c1